MRVGNNGTSEKNIGRRHNGLRRSNEQERLGEPGSYSTRTRNGTIRSVAANSTRTDSFGTGNAERDTDPGKILRRLQILRQQYLAYVDAEQHRLEAQIEDNKKRKATFLDLSKELEQEIYGLITEQENQDNNGHK